MNSVLVWILVYVNGYNVVSYSPPMATLNSCEFLQKQVSEMRWNASGKCVQIEVKQ